MAKWLIDCETLDGLYWVESKSLSEIGRIYGVDPQTVLNRMRELGITRRNYRDSLKGRKIPWGDKIADSLRGIPHTDDRRRRVSESTKGRIPWNAGKRKATSPELSNSGNPGEKHWNWKGGISKENSRLRQSSEYKAWREAVFQRDNWTCQSCSCRGGKLEADHIKSFAHHPELRFEVSNGRTLCKPCHKEVTKEQRLWLQQQ